MSHRVMFVTLGLALLAGCGGRGSATSPASGSDALSTTTGRYAYTGNPCTTDPCLPGMAYAVLANERLCYLTVDGNWFDENRSWAGYTPEVGDLVAVRGYLAEKKDIFGEPYCVIEVASVEPAK
jgi:hypothetical protein